MSNLTLFAIAAEYRAITDVLLDSGCDEQTLMDTLEGEQWDMQLKAQNYGFAIRNLQSTASAIKEAEAQMAARRKAMEKRAEYLQDRLMLGMQIAGVTKLDCPYFALTIKKRPPSVDVFEPALVPAHFMRQPETPPPAVDKVAIAAAIKSGIEVPGAKLVDDNVRLEIK